MGAMKPEAHSGSPLARRFQRFLSRLALHARDDLQHLPLQTHRRIHALRTRMKKLAAILLLVRSRMRDAEYRAILASARRLKQAFTRQRDARVAADLSSRIGVHPRKKPLPRLRPVAPLFIEAAILERLLGDAAFNGLRHEEVLSAYVKSYRTGRRRWKACLEDPAPDLLHAWRKAVKKFFYQSLALRQLKGGKHRIQRSRKLGKWLGRDRDWHLLAEQARKDPDANAAKLVEGKRARAQRHIFKLAKKLYKKSPRDLQQMLEKHLP
jgi:hypothetical protein